MSVQITIQLTQIGPTHHQFLYRRADGTGESLELETKTFLFHDFLHFAVESEAGLSNSFYGLLAQSESYAALSAEGAQSDMRKEIGMTERIVGALTGAIKGDIAPKEVIVGLKNMSDAYGDTLPEWITPEFVVKVKERMKKLLGEWNSTPFGQTMELYFEPVSNSRE